MRSYTESVEYQCSRVDSLVGAIETAEAEFSNVEGHVDTAKDLAEEIKDMDWDSPEDLDLAYIRSNSESIYDEMDDATVDLVDGVEALSNQAQEAELLRCAITELRQIAEDLPDQFYSEVSEKEAQIESLEEDISNLNEENNELNADVDAKELRIAELEHLLSPQLGFKFMKSVGQDELERWEESQL